MNDLFDYLLAIQRGGGGGGKKEIVYIESQTVDITSITNEQIKAVVDAGALPVLVDNTTLYYPAVISSDSYCVFVGYSFGSGAISAYSVAMTGETTWELKYHPYFESLLLYYNESTISSSDFNALLIGEKTPILFDNDAGAYINSVHYESNKLIFDAIDLSSGKYVRYSYLVGDPNPWGKIELPIGELANFFCEPNTTTFMEIVEAVQAGRQPIINDIPNGRVYYVAGYTMSGSDPVAIKFSTIDKGIKHVWTVDYTDAWTSETYGEGLYYVEPSSTTFMTIVELLQNNIQPVINDIVNGRAYYISDYTIVGGQPAAITFSTIGANTPHTWTVDYQDNWTST